MLTSFTATAAKRAARHSLSTLTLNNHLCRSYTSTTIKSSLQNDKPVLYDVVPKQDFGEFKEYSVIFTNRSLNLMSDPFQKVMRDLNTLLCKTYNADKVAIIPG